MLQFIKKNSQIFLFLISIDLLFLLLHLLFARNWTFFHLDYEMNLPTFWQSGKLILFGGLFFLANFTKKISKTLKSFMLPLAIFITFLGLDELLQIHENIYRIFEFFPWLHPSKIVDASMKLGYRSSLWILYYLPFIFLFVFWSGYWLRYFQDKIRGNFWIILVSSFSLLTVLIMEIMSSTGTYSDSTYFIMVTIEESAEMLLGSTLILVGLKVLDRAISGKHKNHWFNF